LAYIAERIDPLLGLLGLAYISQTEKQISFFDLQLSYNPVDSWLSFSFLLDPMIGE